MKSNFYTKKNRNLSTEHILILAGTILFFFFHPALYSGQAVATDKTISFSGYVKTDLYFDTRNTASARDGQFMLFPLNVVRDSEGKDINSNPQFNIISIQTRLRTSITGPDAFGAKSSGFIETAFFGSAEGNINTLRMRHAFLKLDWDKTELLVGQTWHPLFVAQSFPGTVSLSTGAPFQAFSRNPQVRLTHSMGSLSAILAAMSHRDGSGPGGTQALRNAVVPNLHAQIQGSAGSILGGAGIDFKRIDIDPQQYDPVNSIAGFGYLNIPVGPITSKSYFIYGENLMDHMLLGGVALHSDGKTLVPYRTVSAWHDLTTGFMGNPENTRFELGLYTGFSRNLGTDEDNIIRVQGFARGMDIDYLYRIAPRAQIQSGPVRFSLELDVTTAAYGDFKSDGTVDKTRDVTNYRILAGAWFFF